MKAKILIRQVLLFLLIATACSQATAYSPPVSWYPMSMPNITYNSTANKLAVETTSAVLLGTNVDPSNGYPGLGVGSFDPAQPWWVLNGAAFSRTLGWYDPRPSGITVLTSVRSVYGPDSNIWIDCTGTSPGLNSYLAVGLWGVNNDHSQTVDYSNFSGVPYSGIFGTNGSSTKWRWDGTMDHNAYTVPFDSLNTPNQQFWATYRLYIGDANGNDLAPAAATTTTWQWQGPTFVFTSQTGTAVNTPVESDVFTVSEIPVQSPWLGSSSLSITGGEYAMLIDTGSTWGAWTSAAGSISNTNRVKVRQTSATGPGLTTTTTLSIPGIPGPGTFHVTTTTSNPAWQVRMDGMDQPSLEYAYSVAQNRVEPNSTVIMLKDGVLSESGFMANRDITVTLSGGYNPDYSFASGATILTGSFSIQRGKVIIEKLTIR